MIINSIVQPILRPIVRAIDEAYGLLRASLSLDFSSGALDPRITFSRTSNATLTGSNGLIQYAPHNLLTYSEQFDNGAWVKTATSVTANTVAAPNGTTTADTVTVTATGNYRTVWEGFTSVAGTTYTFSAYVKAGNKSWCSLTFTDGAVNGNGWYFDVTTGQVGGTTGLSGGTTVTRVSSQITDAGNGWWRCQITCTISNAATYYAAIGVVDANNSPATTNGSTQNVWGAQLEIGSTATAYNPTTVKNLLGYTQEFDNAAWTKSNSSIAANAVAAPDGSMTADKLVEDSSTNAHYTTAVGAITFATYPGGLMFSCYAKAAERSKFLIGYSSAGNLTQTNCIFDLVAKTATVTNAFGWSVATGAVTDIGNGWYRCSFRVSTNGSAYNPNPTLAVINNSGSISYTGDGTSGIYIWGAQLSDSASVDPYVYNPVAAPSAAAYYGPRFDYDPVTLAPKGLLIEEQRSQLLLNSSLAGTSLATQNVTVAAVAHTLSFYGTGQVVLSGTAVATVTGTGAYPSRQTYTFTPTAGTLTLTVTGTVQFAQLEVGAFATSFIPSAASQVTRAADNASMLGANFSNWYNQTTGAAFVDYGIIASGSITLPVMEFNDGTTNNRTLFQNNPSTNSRVLAFVGGSAVVTTLDATSTMQTKVAAAYSAGSWAASYNGATALTNSYAGVVPGQTQLLIGYTTAGGNPRLNGTIKRIAYYNRRLSNSELQAITA